MTFGLTGKDQRPRIGEIHHVSVKIIGQGFLETTFFNRSITKIAWRICIQKLKAHYKHK